MKYYEQLGKRMLDIAASSVCLALLSPLFILIAILIVIDNPGNPFFVQRRIGKSMKPFKLIKFRSMTPARRCLQAEFNPGNTQQVTRIGKLLRLTKLDELPELFNIVLGDMSLIGPRPEIEKYVLAFSKDYKKILRVRPGLSDAASIKYRHEENILAVLNDPEAHYVNVILPDKIRYAKEYTKEICFRTDVRLIFDTIKSLF